VRGSIGFLPGFICPRGTRIHATHWCNWRSDDGMPNASTRKTLAGLLTALVRSGSIPFGIRVYAAASLASMVASSAIFLSSPAS
jgi:hypothetical protein